VNDQVISPEYDFLALVTWILCLALAMESKLFILARHMRLA